MEHTLRDSILAFLTSPKLCFLLVCLHNYSQECSSEMWKHIIIRKTEYGQMNIGIGAVRPHFESWLCT